MKGFVSFLILFTVLFVVASNSFAVGIEVAVGGWAQSPKGHLSYQSALPADSFDLEREAGFDDESRLSGRVIVDLPVLPNIYFMATPMEFEGNGSKSFTFGGTSMSGSLYSKAKLDHYDLALYYGIPLSGIATAGTFGLDIGIDVRQMNIDMVVRETLTSVTDSVKETIYIPMIYLAVQIKPTDFLALEIEARGISYSDSHYYDFIGRLKYSFAGVAFAAAGWRQEDLEIDEKDILATVKISGPFAEVGLKF